MISKLRRPQGSKTFEALVAEALDSLPPDIQEKLENVEVVVEWRPSPAQLRRLGIGSGHTLFGLYEGVPLTGRTSSYGMVLPDKITIFQQPIEAVCQSNQQVRHVVRRTVLHELAHHFGLSDERLRELGVY
ncbi:MAG: metallopeptidase family protein [Anaerolineales bacterium]|nr:MAG: metallopeptidase family protein [Anaerolineales bacterium]